MSIAPSFWDIPGTSLGRICPKLRPGDTASCCWICSPVTIVTDWFKLPSVVGLRVAEMTTSDALTTGISSDCSVLPDSAANSGRAGYKTSRPIAIMTRFLTVEYTRCIFMVAQNPFMPCVGSL